MRADLLPIKKVPGPSSWIGDEVGMADQDQWPDSIIDLVERDSPLTPSHSHWSRKLVPKAGA